MFVTKLSLVCAFGVIYECFIWNYVMNFQGIIGDFSSIKKDIMEDALIVTKYCCPIKINWKLCISLPNGVTAVLLIQGLGFQFQTVSIIKCAYFDKESL